MRIDRTTYRKDLKYPKRQPDGYYHGYGGVTAWTLPRRDLASLRSILIHTTNNPDGNTSYPSEATFLLDSPNVSAQYVVSSHDDTIIQELPDDYIAWHAGDCLDNDFENLRSIGIEIAWAAGKGPIPQIAIENTTELVRSLLGAYSSIVKLDMHRAQAPGRKIDPSGWENAAFYRWRDQMLRERRLSRYIARYSQAVFTSRELPDTVALDGAAVVGIGDVILCDDLTAGWLHIAPSSPILGNVGFVPVGAFRLMS